MEYEAMVMKIEPQTLSESEVEEDMSRNSIFDRTDDDEHLKTVKEESDVEEEDMSHNYMIVLAEDDERLKTERGDSDVEEQDMSQNSRTADQPWDDSWMKREFNVELNEDEDEARTEEDPHSRAMTAHAPVASASGSGSKKRRPYQRSTLTEAQKLEVVEWLRDKPQFYKKNHKGFKDLAARKREWRQLAEEMGVSVDELLNWYRSMRTMLARAKKMMHKSKNGSGTMRLTRSLQWVWDNFQYMAPYIENLSQDIVSNGRDAPQLFEPERPGPGTARSSRPSESATTTTTTLPSSAIPVALPVASQPSGSGFPSATPATSTTSHTECGGSGALLEQVLALAAKVDDRQDPFWRYMESKCRDLSPKWRALMEKKVFSIVQECVDGNRAETERTLFVQ